MVINKLTRIPAESDHLFHHCLEVRGQYDGAVFIASPLQLEVSFSQHSELTHLLKLTKARGRRGQPGRETIQGLSSSQRLHWTNVEGGETLQYTNTLQE